MTDLDDTSPSCLPDSQRTLNGSGFTRSGMPSG